jgi:hypothetical protein
MAEKRPHPIRSAATWPVLIAAVGSILLGVGVAQDVVGTVVAVAGQLLVIAAALGLLVTTAESEVTPVEDPMTRLPDGSLVRLVPEVGGCDATDPPEGPQDHQPPNEEGMEGYY